MSSSGGYEVMMFMKLTIVLDKSSTGSKIGLHHLYKQGDWQNQETMQELHAWGVVPSFVNSLLLSPRETVSFATVHLRDSIGLDLIVWTFQLVKNWSAVFQTLVHHLRMSAWTWKKWINQITRDRGRQGHGDSLRSEDPYQRISGENRGHGTVGHFDHCSCGCSFRCSSYHFCPHQTNSKSNNCRNKTTKRIKSFLVKATEGSFPLPSPFRSPLRSPLPSPLSPLLSLPLPALPLAKLTWIGSTDSCIFQWCGQENHQQNQVERKWTLLLKTHTLRCMAVLAKAIDTIQHLHISLESKVLSVNSFDQL